MRIVAVATEPRFDTFDPTRLNTADYPVGICTLVILLIQEFTSPCSRRVVRSAYREYTSTVVQMAVFDLFASK